MIKPCLIDLAVNQGDIAMADAEEIEHASIADAKEVQEAYAAVVKEKEDAHLENNK